MTAPLILIVEDCADTLDCYAALFRDHHFRVVTAANGAEALLAVQLHVPDVVLTDIDMPLLDGIGLALRLRDHAPTASIPIVAVTGSTLNRIVQRARESGCDTVVLKPCVPERVLSTVCALVQSRAHPRTMRSTG